LATMGQFSNPDDTDYIAETLEGRLERILTRYLSILSPITDLRVEGKNRVCGVDLAAARNVAPPATLRFRAAMRSRTAARALDVEVRAGGQVCAALPDVAGDGGAADDAPERYVVVRIEDGFSRGPLEAHLYDLGPSRGYRLVAVQRPSP